MTDSRTKIRQLNEQKKRDNLALALLDVLIARRGLGVTDPRDVVFAHLGMIGMHTKEQLTYQPQQHSTPPRNEDLIAINYEKTVAQVYEDTARYILKEIPHMWFLLFAQIEAKNESERREGLPSWVPDWTQQLQPNNDASGYKAERRGRSKSYSHPGFLFPSPGVLGMLGHTRSTVVAMIRGSSLPHTETPRAPWIANLSEIGSSDGSSIGHSSDLDSDYDTSSVESEGEITNHDIWKWISSRPEEASEVLRVLLEYLINMTRHYKKIARNLQREDSEKARGASKWLSEYPMRILNPSSFPPSDPDYLSPSGGATIPELNALLLPNILRWSNEFPLPSFRNLSPIMIQRKRDQLTQGLTEKFIDSLVSLFQAFNHRNASGNDIALTSSNTYEPVPPGTCINDIIGNIVTSHPQKGSVIFRPEPIHQVQFQYLDDSMRRQFATIVQKLKWTTPGPNEITAVKHCKYVTTYKRLEEFIRKVSVIESRDLEYPDFQDTVVFAIH